jgi:hypothetical protein
MKCVGSIARPAYIGPQASPRPPSECATVNAIRLSLGERSDDMTRIRTTLLIAVCVLGMHAAVLSRPTPAWAADETEEEVESDSLVEGLYPYAGNATMDQIDQTLEEEGAYDPASSADSQE